MNNDGGNKKEMSANNSRARGSGGGRIVSDEGKEGLVAEALNRLAREQLKLKLLADISADIEVCKIEGWDFMEYLNELKEIIDSFVER